MLNNDVSWNQFLIESDNHKKKNTQNKAWWETFFEHKKKCQVIVNYFFSKKISHEFIIWHILEDLFFIKVLRWNHIMSTWVNTS